MLLENKNAVIYGGGGSVGAAVARAFSREGAKVFLVGRTLTKLDAVAQEISNAGGKAETAQVDAMDEQTVNQHLDHLEKSDGGVDIAFNLIDLGHAQGAPLVEMTPEFFMNAIMNAMRSHFITGTAAGRHMAKKGSGVILALTAQVARKPYLNSGGFGVAGAAIEGLCRQLAVELGPQGIRVVVLRSSGSPDTPGVAEAMRLHAKNAGVSLEEWEAKIAQSNMLKRLPRLADVANVAALMASDRASVVTGAVTNVTCGELVD